MKALLVLLVFMMLLACSKDDNSNYRNEIQDEWHYISFLSEGTPICNYERGEKVYIFFESTLKVNDNYLEDDICNITLMQQGEYTYEIKIVDQESFLFVDDREIGKISFDNGNLFVDSGVRYDGTIIDDAASYQFED